MDTGSKERGDLHQPFSRGLQVHSPGKNADGFETTEEEGFGFINLTVLPWYRTW